MGRSVLVLFHSPALSRPSLCHVPLRPHLCFSVSQHADVSGQNPWHCDYDFHTQHEKRVMSMSMSEGWVGLVLSFLQGVEEGHPTHNLWYQTSILVFGLAVTVYTPYTSFYR